MSTFICKPCHRRLVQRIHPGIFPFGATRSVSVTGAIKKGLRASHPAESWRSPGGGKFGRSDERPRVSEPETDRLWNREPTSYSGASAKLSREWRNENNRRMRDSADSRPSRREGHHERRSEGTHRTRDWPNSRPFRLQDNHPQHSGLDVPVKYTTAASVFLYGLNVVYAAMKANTRKLYRLHLSPRSGAKTTELTDLATRQNVKTTIHRDDSQLDAMSKGRPHNGVVLETSLLPAPPVLSFSKANPRDFSAIATLGPQNSEEAAVNGSVDLTLKPRARFPFVVMLDGILDEGNLGGIIRSAYFLGVDAVVVATNTCAQINSAIVAKASSGACDAVQLFQIPRPTDFVYSCRQHGWSVYASVPRDNVMAADRRRKLIGVDRLSAESPLQLMPCLLVIGGEGKGLPERLIEKANRLVTIDPAVRRRGIDVGIESLNVSVAAGLLMNSFLASSPTGHFMKSLRNTRRQQRST